MKPAEKIYYSLDIETSGFDPESNEILEVGFVAFQVQGSRFKIREKWSKVFKPKHEVHSRVLGLTGISQKELDAGEKIQDSLFFLQGKLGQATIVGHNVGFDIKFLQQYGLKFSGEVIDTLDLVQFLLPTHHSYNLENLAHEFRISHKHAHRALADAEASLTLLERLLGIYQALPLATRRQIQNLAEQIKAPWAELLSLPFKSYTKSLSSAPGKIHLTRPRAKPVSLKDKTIHLAPARSDVLDVAKQVINQTNEPLLLVVPKRQQVLELWRQNLARGIFQPRYLFNPKKLAILQAHPATADEARFLMKLLVWQATNWQSNCLLDLNLSFFGGQFKDLVSGQSLPQVLSDRVLCCDHQTFLELKKHRLFKDRALVIFGLGDFERAITLTIGERSSWGYAVYLLRAIYDPESGLGSQEAKDVVTQLLADADLFFGLTNALLMKFNHGWGQVVVDERLRNSAEFLKITQAAEHFVQKLSPANKSLDSLELENFGSKLKNFFIDRPDFISWIDIGERSCQFHALPLDIRPLVKESLAGFARTCFFEPTTQEAVVNYFTDRLGLKDWAREFWGLEAKSLSKLGVAFRPTAKYEFIQAGDETLLDLLGKGNLPAVVVFETPAEIGEVYKNHYQELKSLGFLQGEQQSGGSSKLFRNFAIHNDSILLVTGRTALNFLRSNQQIQSVPRLGPRTLVFRDLPGSQVADPYSKALARQYQSPDQEFWLPLVLYDFYYILQLCQSNKLKHVYINSDRKHLNKAKLFAEALKSS